MTTTLEEPQQQDLEETETEETQEGEQQTEEEENWQPPSREDWDKVHGVLSKQKADIKTLRREIGALKAGKNPDEESKNEEIAAELARWKDQAVRASATTALHAAGFSGTAAQARKLTRLLDLDDAEPGDDFELDFEEEIGALKNEFPQLFKPADADSPRRRRSDSEDRGGNQNSSTSPYSPTSRALRRQWQGN